MGYLWENAPKGHSASQIGGHQNLCKRVGKRVTSVWSLKNSQGTVKCFPPRLHPQLRIHWSVKNEIISVRHQTRCASWQAKYLPYRCPVSAVSSAYSNVWGLPACLSSPAYRRLFHIRGTWIKMASRELNGQFQIMFVPRKGSIFFFGRISYLPHFC